jgi:hypothetical protein
MPAVYEGDQGLVMSKAQQAGRPANDTSRVSQRALNQHLL